MKKPNQRFLDNFIEALHQKTGQRKDLVNFISETLDIERGAASRRLNKKIFFNVDEMGKLSERLGISLDMLLSYEGGYPHVLPYALQLPMTLDSIDVLIHSIKQELDKLDKLEDHSIEAGVLFSYFPSEFLIPYRYLIKFSYFKWRYLHVNVNKDDFSDYSSWDVPDELIKLNDRIMDIVHKKCKKKLYIWDISTIHNLVYDIKYFRSISVLDTKNTELIKNDLHKMLYDVEKIAGNTDSGFKIPKEVELYVTPMHLAGNYSYGQTPDKAYCSSYDVLLGIKYSDDYKMCIKIREWINSMKKLCTLISDSGIRERRMFFNDQHEIVDKLL